MCQNTSARKGPAPASTGAKSEGSDEGCMVVDNRLPTDQPPFTIKTLRVRERQRERQNASLCVYAFASEMI